MQRGDQHADGALRRRRSVGHRVVQPCSIRLTDARGTGRQVVEKTLGAVLNLNDVHLFVQAVDRGGFTRAARELGLPKSTLSKRVTELERELGVSLLERSSRRFVLTEVGREFHSHATAMLIEAAAAEDCVRGRLAEPRGIVRITCSH